MSGMSFQRAKIAVISLLLRCCLTALSKSAKMEISSTISPVT